MPQEYKMEFEYDLAKNSQLLKSRGVGFEEIVQAVYSGQLLDIRVHHNKQKYPNQKIMYVRILEEVYAVPFVEGKTGKIFLKTLFPSRKARKFYLAEID